MASAAPRRAAHRPSRRQEIIEAGISVFAQNGISASIADVAKASSMSQASIYYHFKNKPEFFTACVAEVAKRIMEARSAQETSGVVLPMRDAVSIVWTWAEHHSAEAKLLYVWAASGPVEAQEIRRRFEEHYVRRMRRRMRQTEPSSTADRTVERLAARTYMTLAMGVAEAWADGQPLGTSTDQRRVAAALAEVSVRLTGVP